MALVGPLRANKKDSSSSYRLSPFASTVICLLNSPRRKRQGARRRLIVAVGDGRRAIGGGIQYRHRQFAGECERGSKNRATRIAFKLGDVRLQGYRRHGQHRLNEPLRT